MSVPTQQLKTPTFVARQEADENKRRLHDVATQAAKLVSSLGEQEREALKTSKAVVVVTQQRWGLGLSFASVTGFVVARLADGRWSAPNFFKVKGGASGFVLGYSKVERVACIKDESTLDRIFLATPGGAEASGIVSAADGATLLQGGRVQADNHRNAEHFGEGADPSKLLKGEIPPPEELAPLYSALA